MPSKTTPNSRKWHRRQVVAYYRGLPTGADADSIAVQKDIVGRWAAENDHEIVEEFVDTVAEPWPGQSKTSPMIKQHVTKQGDDLYVIRLDTKLWRRWRSSAMSLWFQNLSKNQCDRAAFVTTDKDLADQVSIFICYSLPYQRCSRNRRAAMAAARRRANRMGNQATVGKPPQP